LIRNGGRTVSCITAMLLDLAVFRRVYLIVHPFQGTNMAAISDTMVREGLPHPLGATWDGDGVNFALFSANATRVELCLFDERDSAPFVPKCVVVDPNFDWKGEPGRRTVPWDHTVIYELNLRGYTKLIPVWRASGEELTKVFPTRFSNTLGLWV